MDSELAQQFLQHNRDIIMGKTKGITIWGFDEEGDSIEYECDLSRRKCEGSPSLDLRAKSIIEDEED